LAELYLADKEQFLQLPAKEYECVRYEQVKADKYGYIRVENKLYSTSPRFGILLYVQVKNELFFRTMFWQCTPTFSSWLRRERHAPSLPSETFQTASLN